MKNKKNYRRSDFKKVPAAVSRLLDSLKEFQGNATWVRDYRKLAASIADTAPFTVVRELMRGVLKVRAFNSEDYTAIKEITVYR